jgi:hypothetical protein
MTQLALQQQLWELNPQIRKPGTDERIRLVGIERITKIGDTNQIVYWLLNAKTNTKTYVTVTVTKRDKVVLGYAR